MMDENEVVRQVKALLGSSASIEFDVNDQTLAPLAVELRKARTKLALVQKHGIAIDIPSPASGMTTMRVYLVGATPVSDPVPPPPVVRKATPTARPKPKRHQHSYVPPKEVKDILSVLTDDASHIIQLVGPTGCGKSTLVKHLGGELGRKVFQINCRGDMGSESFIGEKTIDVDPVSRQNRIVYQKGVMEKAFIEGLDDNGQEVGEPAILFIDELTACPAHVAHVLNRAFESDDPRRTLVLDTDGGRVVRSHSGLRIIVAGNTAGRGANNTEQTAYAAQLDALDISLLSRVAVTVRMGYNKMVEQHILTEKVGDDRVVQMVVKLRDAVRGHIRAGKLTTPFTTRHVINIADLYRIFGDLAKAVYFACVEQLLPEERATYNETFLAITGKDMLQAQVSGDIDYM